MTANLNEEIPDASEQYHLWDHLVTVGFRIALSTAHETPEEKTEAAERLARGMAWALKERDEMWTRLLQRRDAARR